MNIGRAFQAYREAHRDFRRAGKAYKQQWFQDRVAGLQLAARARDTRALYAGVRSLAPKQHKVKIQLRDAHGQLQDPAAQIWQLEQHYRKLYAADLDKAVAGHLPRSRRTRPRRRIRPPTRSGASPPT